MLLLSKLGAEVQTSFLVLRNLSRKKKLLLAIVLPQNSTTIPLKLSTSLMMFYIVPHVTGTIRSQYDYDS